MKCLDKLLRMSRLDTAHQFAHDLREGHHGRLFYERISIRGKATIAWQKTGRNWLKYRSGGPNNLLWRGENHCYATVLDLRSVAGSLCNASIAQQSVNQNWGGGE